MRRLAAVALALATALPVCAQRGGGHAGFAGHSAPAMRAGPSFGGGFAPPTSFHYSGTAHAPMISGPNRAYGPYGPSRMTAPGLRYPATAPGMRPSFYHHGAPITTTHNFIIRSYPYGYGSGYYPSAVYLPYGGFYDDSYDNSNDNYDVTQQPPPGADSGYPQPDYNYPPPPDGYAYPQPMPQPEYGYAYPQPMPAYPGYPQPAPDRGYSVEPAPGYIALGPSAPNTPNTPQMQYVPGSSEYVILIYKDGRPPEQIQNYLVTRTTLTILDGSRRREVPLSDLDLPATTRANHQTGVDFRLPTATP